MQIQHLSLKNFRNYARLELGFPPGNVLVYGENAQGKTSLLEALYYLATSSTPYATSDRQLINWRTKDDPLPFAQVSADVLSADRTLHQLSITLTWEAPGTPAERFKKEIRLNKAARRRAEILGLITVVMFLPQDLLLVEGSPSERRRYMNMTLNQVDGAYTDALNTFEKVLTQRNALLKQISRNRAGADELLYWDEQLTQAAAVIIAGRQRFLREIEHEAADIYRALSGHREDLRLAYVPSFEPTAEGSGQLSFGIPGLDLHRQLSPAQIAPQFAEALHANRYTEIERGMTLFGPQRDELRFFVNEHDLGLYGSRGQARTAVLAIKLAELAWMEARIGEPPLLLLDEVASELDEHRRAYLLEQIRHIPQVLLTTTEPAIFNESFLSNATLWKVQAGQIEAFERG
ncbi:MAG: DNA replication/repair protein RecF [Anaerolineales bacterium]